MEKLSLLNIPLDVNVMHSTFKVSPGTTVKHLMRLDALLCYERLLTQQRFYKEPINHASKKVILQEVHKVFSSTRICLEVYHCISVVRFIFWLAVLGALSVGRCRQPLPTTWNMTKKTIAHSLEILKALEIFISTYIIYKILLHRSFDKS